MTAIGYFFLSLIIFIVFTTFITIFGYFLQYHLSKVFKSNKISLTILLESFGVGTVLFICYSYLIIDFLKIFNFYTIYLPLILFDAVNIIYYLYKNRSLSKENFQEFIDKINNLISNKRNKNHIGILIIVFLLFLLVQAVIETNLNFPERDPYNWFSIIMYLHKYGDLNYDNYTVHGMGFVFYVAASLLITNNFYLQYYFIKYVSSFFFSIVILAVYEISSKFFKKNYEILITLIVLLCFNSLLFRFSLAVPSILATTLGVIFINTLHQKDNLKVTIIRGLLLGGIFLSHPLYFLLLFGYLFLFELLMLFRKFKENLKTREIKFLDMSLIFIKRNGIPLLIVSFITIPYFLNLFLSDTNFLKNFTRYLSRGYSATIHILNQNFLISASDGLFLVDLKPSRTDLFYNLIFFGFNIPINKTLNWGVVFLISGLFYSTESRSHQQAYLIEFIKFTFILTFTIFIVDSFLFIIDNITVLSIASFINQYGKRIFELYSPIWAILFILGVIKILEFIKTKKKKKIERDSSTMEKLINELEKKYEKISLVILIILGVSLYSSHLYFQYNVIYTSHYEDDYLTEALLFIGDYFNSNDIEDETILLPDNFDSKVIYRLIYHKNCDRDYLEYDNTNHTELWDAIVENDADYVLVYKLETKNSCLDKIDKREEVLYENPNYLFFKT